VTTHTKSREAKSANERQKSPNKNACSAKFEIVSCVAFQHKATVGIFHFNSFRLVKLTLLQLFSKALACRIVIAFAGKLDQDQS